MIILICGATHTGKTVLAQRLLSKYGYPYLSLDHLKMGLIRSGNTALTPSDEAELTEYLWPIAREMAKTALENRQNLIIEGLYIPFSWAEDFSASERREVRALWLIMSEQYIREHFDAIAAHACDIEARLAPMETPLEKLLEANRRNLSGCQKLGCPYLLIDGEYRVEWEP